MTILANKLAEHPLMRGLNSDEIERLSVDAIPMTFQAGEMLFKQGQKAEHLHLIIKGKVTVGVKYGSEHLPITIIHPGETLGWDWLFPPYKWEFEGKALTNVETIALIGKPVADIMGQDPLLGYTLMRHLAYSLASALTATRQRLIQAHLEFLQQTYKNQPLSDAQLAAEILAKTSGSIL